MQIPGDALSDVLKMVHLRACIYFVKDMPSGWGMEIPATANGPLHMVLDGSTDLPPPHHGKRTLAVLALVVSAAASGLAPISISALAIWKRISHNTSLPFDRSSAT